MRQHTQRNRVTTFDFVVWIGLFIIGFLFIYYLLSRPDVSNFTVEILAVTIGVVLVVVSVGVTIHIQTQYELEREFQVKIYDIKLKRYCDLLMQIAQMDDDNRIDDEEIEKIRNKAREISLLADKDVLLNLACFVWILEKTKVCERKISIDHISDSCDHRKSFICKLRHGGAKINTSRSDDSQGARMRVMRSFREPFKEPEVLDSETGTLRRIVAAMRKDLEVSQKGESSVMLDQVVWTLVDKEKNDEDEDEGRDSPKISGESTSNAS